MNTSYTNVRWKETKNMEPCVQEQKDSHSRELTVQEYLLLWKLQECQKMTWKLLSQQKEYSTQQYNDLTRYWNDISMITQPALMPNYSTEELLLINKSLCGIHQLVQCINGDKKSRLSLCINQASTLVSRLLNVRITRVKARVDS